MQCIGIPSFFIFEYLVIGSSEFNDGAMFGVDGESGTGRGGTGAVTVTVVVVDVDITTGIGADCETVIVFVGDLSRFPVNRALTEHQNK